MSSSVKALGQARPLGAGLAPMTCCCFLATLQRWLPFLAWLPHYSLQWLKMDFIAGLSVGLTVIPQALAYAEVAGLPPQVRRLPLLAAPTSPPHRLTPLWASVPAQKQSRNAWYHLQTRGAPRAQSHGARETLAYKLEHVTAFGRTHAL